MHVCVCVVCFFSFACNFWFNEEKKTNKFRWFTIQKLDVDNSRYKCMLYRIVVSLRQRAMFLYDGRITHTHTNTVDSIKHKNRLLHRCHKAFYVKKFIYISNRFHNITVIRIYKSGFFLFLFF